jgi:hypothetical protein
MEIETGPSCVVSGSFRKFKDRIDETIAIFKSRGIRVLSPDPGSLFKSSKNSLWTPDSYPLASELYISEKTAKSQHTEAIKQADFLYIVNPGRYTGKSVLEEFGVAYFSVKDIYAAEPFDPALDEYDPKWLNMIQCLQVMDAREVADSWSKKSPRRYFYVAASRQTIDKMIADSGFIDHMKPVAERIYLGLR